MDEEPKPLTKEELEEAAKRFAERYGEVIKKLAEE